MDIEVWDGRFGQLTENIRSDVELNSLQSR